MKFNGESADAFCLRPFVAAAESRAKERIINFRKVARRDVNCGTARTFPRGHRGRSMVVRRRISREAKSP